MKISSVKFIKSAPDIERRPEKALSEVVVIGRSNVGKSSLINMLLDSPGMAKTSSMPGKTQLINYFEVNDERYLVDFPGYGYAKKSRDSRIDWMDAMQEYLLENDKICDFLLLINSHLPPQKNDLMMYESLVDFRIPVTIVMTKADRKMKQGVLKGHVSQRKEIVSSFEQDSPIYITSADTRAGRQEVLEHIGAKIAISRE